MKFSVKAWSKGGRARSGVLYEVGSCPHSIETPALLLTTRKGLPLFISPDLLPSLPFPDSQLLQLSPLHFLEGISPKTIATIGGVHGMLGLSQQIFAAVPRDSITSLPVYDSSNKSGASFETPGGRRLMKPEDYMELISAMKPNFWVSLPDEVPGWASHKRNRLSVDRTIRWLDDCLALNVILERLHLLGVSVKYPTCEIVKVIRLKKKNNDQTLSSILEGRWGIKCLFLSSGIKSVTGGTVFGSIVGGSSMIERQRCTEEVARRNVSGFWIGGFGLGESMEERPALLSAITDCLPEEKPRHVSGLGLPEEVLQGVAAGIDLFDSTYIYHLTLGGFALAFSLEENVSGGISKCQQNDIGNDGTKINLKSTIYRKDTSPIVEGCKCYTCQRHTKSYINHLYNVHEMLAQTLIEMHNTHHYMGFFRSIRASIKEGKFDEFRKAFVGRRRDNLAAASTA